MKHAHIYLVAIVLLHLGVAGLQDAYLWLYAPDDGEGLVRMAWMNSPATYCIPLLFLLCAWCFFDARGRQVRLPFWAAALVAVSFPIGVPYYYWRTYPRRKAIMQIGLFAIFAVVCTAALWAGHKLVNYYFVELD